MRNYERAEQIGMKQESEERRKSNRERSASLLQRLGVDFDSKNDGAHLIVTHNGVTVDFWPGTGKFIPRKPKPKHGRGVFNMLATLGIAQPKQEAAHESHNLVQ